MTTTPPVFGPVRVELLTAETRVKGNCRELDDVHSLGDLLNQGPQRLKLAPALLRELDGASPRIEPELAIARKQLIAAWSTETPSQILQRRLHAAPGEPPARTVSVIVAAPPYAIWGELTGARDATRRSRSGGRLETGELDPQRLPRFVSLSGATLLLGERVLDRPALVYVNRDAIASLRRVRDHRAAGQRLSERFRGVS